MADGTELASLVALVGEPARAKMLAALMSGAALTATELALEAGVAPSTASAHLTRLNAANIVALEQRGRHRYFRLSDTEIAHALESLMGAAAGRLRRQPGPAYPEMREARVCYDHLAGSRGVWVFDQLNDRGLVPRADTDRLTSDGQSFFSRLGIEVATLAGGRRPLCRLCLDWSERRHHLGGALGAAILDRIFALGWARRKPGGRALLFTSAGERDLRRAFER